MLLNFFALHQPPRDECHADVAEAVHQLHHQVLGYARVLVLAQHLDKGVTPLIATILVIRAGRGAISHWSAAWR